MSRPKHFWFCERLGEIELVPRLVVLLNDVNKYYVKEEFIDGYLFQTVTSSKLTFTFLDAVVFIYFLGAIYPWSAPPITSRVTNDSCCQRLAVTRMTY